MTVSELIEELQKHSGNIRVVVKGYEDGVDEVQTLKILKLKLNTSKQWYYGKHSVAEDNDNYDEFGLFIC